MVLEFPEQQTLVIQMAESKDCQVLEFSANANADGTVSYTPDDDFNGADTFAYTVDDDEGKPSADGIVTVTVTAVNDDPEAVNDVAVA